MGVIGVAPSGELLQRAGTREADLLQRGGMGIGPSPDGAMPASGPIARAGLRTIPPRENGGNIDIRHLTDGTTVYFPVFVPGALFSAGTAEGRNESEDVTLAAKNALFSMIDHIVEKVRIHQRAGLRHNQYRRRFAHQ